MPWEIYIIRSQEPELGFDLWTSGSLAQRSTTLLPAHVQILLLRSDNISLSIPVQFWLFPEFIWVCENLIHNTTAINIHCFSNSYPLSFIFLWYIILKFTENKWNFYIYAFYELIKTMCLIWLQCLVSVTKKCRCGLYSKELPCQKEFLCETKCKRTKECMRHPCNRKVNK